MIVLCCCVLYLLDDLRVAFYLSCFFFFCFSFFVFLMIRRPPRSTLDRSSAASDVYKRQSVRRCVWWKNNGLACQWTNDNDRDFYCKVWVDTFTINLNPFAVCANSFFGCLLYTSPSPRDRTRYRMPSSAWKKKHK